VIKLFSSKFLLPNIINRFICGEYEKPDHDKMLLLKKKRVNRNIHTINDLLKNDGKIVNARHHNSEG
jgi:hypothetical protein